MRGRLLRALSPGLVGATVTLIIDTLGFRGFRVSGLGFMGYGFRVWELRVEIRIL